MDDEEPQYLEKLLETHRVNLRHFKKQEAKHSFDVPVSLHNNILHEEKEIANIEAKLNARTLAINRIDLEQNRQEAWRAFYRRNWEEAVELLEKVAVKTADDKDIQNKLTYAHWQLRLQRDYCNICCLRDEDDPQAVLNALEDLSQPQQDYPGKSYPSLSTI